MCVHMHITSTYNCHVVRQELKRNAMLMRTHSLIYNSNGWYEMFGNGQKDPDTQCRHNLRYMRNYSGKKGERGEVLRQYYDRRWKGSSVLLLNPIIPRFVASKIKQTIKSELSSHGCV